MELDLFEEVDLGETLLEQAELVDLIISAAQDSERVRIVNDVLSSALSPRDEIIIRMKHGIGYQKGHTFTQIGERFNITKDRASNVYHKALKRLCIVARRQLEGLL